MPIKTRGDLLRGELAFALAKAVKIVRDSDRRSPAKNAKLSPMRP